MTDISNIGGPGGITPPQNTPNTPPPVGTPNQDDVNALQNQLNAADPASPAGGSTPATPGSGISAADMKLFMDEMTKFCIQQGISTTPKATRD